MATQSDESCPIPGCGKTGPGYERGDELHIKCPIHGSVIYNYDTEIITNK